MSLHSVEQDKKYIYYRFTTQGRTMKSSQVVKKRRLIYSNESINLL